MIALLYGEPRMTQGIDIVVELPVVSRVDAAVSKLAWISKGSHKSRRDLRQMYRASSEFDRQRIGELAQQFGLKPLLDEVLNERDELA